MNCFEEYLVELLKDHVIVHQRSVPVVKHFSNAPELPVITLDLSGGVTTEHVFYDMNDTELVIYRRKANININVWCNNEEDRQNIINQILNCYYKERNNHYTYCTNTNCNCKVKTIHNSRTCKDKCPDPEVYNYQSLESKHHIVQGEVLIEPSFDMDEVDKHPPLLRSILRCTALYDEPVIKHGVNSDVMSIGDIIVK